ncbi:MAG: DnaJ C-terminal domain-containing protein [Spirochaetia bacterium]
MAVKYQDYYKILGVSRTASQDEIQSAYRKLARKYHPDINKSKDAEQKFKEIGEAYEVLKDPEKRKKYDALGANWKAGEDFRPPPGWDFEGFGNRQSGQGTGGFDFNFFGDNEGGRTGFSDFFESIFGGNFDIFGGGRSKTHRQSRQKGKDSEAKLTITLEEAYKGGRKTITLQTVEPDQQGTPQRTTKNLDVRIPPGITPGKKLRLEGQGGQGIGGGPPGDLYLLIDIAPHSVFTVQEGDLETKVNVSPSQAALGAKISVPLLDGRANITIPPGTQSGRRLRLKGKGLNKGKNVKGDLYAVIQVQVPKNLTPRERELYEELDKAGKSE